VATILDNVIYLAASGAAVLSYMMQYEPTMMLWLWTNRASRTGNPRCSPTFQLSVSTGVPPIVEAIEARETN
jgi:hypothetical protein